MMKQGLFALSLAFLLGSAAGCHRNTRAEDATENAGDKVEDATGPN